MDIDNIISGAVGDLLQDQQPEIKKNETRGRKNRGLTDKHYEQNKADMRKEYKAFKNTKNAETFEVVERVRGEVVTPENIEEFKALYSITADTVLNSFIDENLELVKKHPYFWYKKLLLEIKKNVPKLDIDNIDKCLAVWEWLCDLLYSLGLYPTFQAFKLLTGINDYQLNKRKDLSPKYVEFLKKINTDYNDGLIMELAYNPYNQTNKIFLAKVQGFIEKTEPKTIEVNHNIRNYDSLPMYKGDIIQDHEA